MKKDNTSQVLYLLVRSLNIHVTRKSIEDESSKHPNKNSLLGISELLNYWNIANEAYHFSFTELAQLPMPFIAILSKKGFVLVTQLNNDYAVVSNEYWKNHKLNIDEFKKFYSGSILVAEKDESSGEIDYVKKHRNELINEWRIPVIASISAILLLGYLLLNSNYPKSFNIHIALLTFFKSVGVLTAIFLLIQSIDANNPLVQKLCSGKNNKDCNAILSSKAAKINSELSWSEVGFFYFAGSWIVLLFNSGHGSLLHILAIINIISLPYTFYSIYYQWRIAKQWCIFCSTVQAVLWAEFFTFIPYLRNTGNPNLSEWINFLTGMAVPILGWGLFKHYLLEEKQIKLLKTQLQRFKYNKLVFNKLLNDQIKYALPDDNDSLIIGNREAQTVITMVSNPFCQPCSRMHKKLDELLNNRNDIKLQVVFSTHNKDNDKKTKVAAHLMSLQSTQDSQSLKRALDDWYEQEQKDFDAWSKIYPIMEKIDSEAPLKMQREWCKTAQVTATPTVFIDGRRLPLNYQPEDLKYFI